MGIDLDPDSLKEKIADAAEDMAVDHIEEQIESGAVECPNCESRSFDAATWKSGSGEYDGSAVCRECNERVELDIDMSNFNKHR
ncbi:hypothetical protein EGH24_02125 [Halonotius terrestris]|uniref:Uncharacterized protein n=1 Tax=Halonotius terrestris TaxID=2487750 RepID=A0A8J8PEF5_9EURY|nr:hypothetical protein [Halonotius terrestris]TQQ83611.1 hypothetical protein EGH24_02125 [Halonotius terrestris]